MPVRVHPRPILRAPRPAMPGHAQRPGASAAAAGTPFPPSTARRTASYSLNEQRASRARPHQTQRWLPAHPARDSVKRALGRRRDSRLILCSPPPASKRAVVGHFWPPALLQERTHQQDPCPSVLHLASRSKFAWVWFVLIVGRRDRLAPCAASDLSLKSVAAASLPFAPWAWTRC